VMEARACAWLLMLGFESAALSLGPAKKDEESAKSPGPLSKQRETRHAGVHTRRMLAQRIQQGNRRGVYSGQGSSTVSIPA
jgi:hypothetical protein